MIDLKEAFEAHDQEHGKFERIERPAHSRPDLCAFLLLDRLVPGAGRPMISAAEHDEIFLDVDCSKLAKVATDEDILELTRCGVRFDSTYNCLAKFV